MLEDMIAALQEILIDMQSISLSRLKLLNWKAFLQKQKSKEYSVTNFLKQNWSYHSYHIVCLRTCLNEDEPMQTGFVLICFFKRHLLRSTRSEFLTFLLLCTRTAV